MKRHHTPPGTPEQYRDKNTAGHHLTRGCCQIPSPANTSSGSGIPHIPGIRVSIKEDHPAPAPLTPPLSPIREAITTLVEPGSVFEIRVIRKDGIASGYFHDPDRALECVSMLDIDPATTGIYFTLNPVNPALLARRAHRIQMRLSRTDATTADTDILSRRWLPIDIDPVRPSGVSASEDERTAAFEIADRIREEMKSDGWTDPIVGDSGNGSHLLYPITLPNTPESLHIIRSVLQTLSLRFSTPHCTVDTANHNASRIWKLYGTMTRKGDSTPERPHRRSRILQIPGDL